MLNSVTVEVAEEAEILKYRSSGFPFCKTTLSREHFKAHSKISEETEEGILEGSRFVLFKEKMSNPRKRVTCNR